MKHVQIIFFFIVIFILSYATFLAPVFASSGDFFDKASLYYEKKCLRNSNKVTKEDSVICYVYDKVHEIDVALTTLTDTVGSTTEEIDQLKEQVDEFTNGKIIEDIATIRGPFFTTTSTTPVPTGSKVSVSCSEACVLSVNYYVDTRNTMQSIDPRGYFNMYSIFVDGHDQAVFTQASFPVPNVAIPLSLNGLFPVSSGSHTVEIYAYVNGGVLESHESGLQVLAIH